MALPGAAAVNFLGSKIAPKERFIKLYRKLHNLFLKYDFVNVKDLKAAITQIEANFKKIDTALQVLFQLATIGHNHVSTPIVGGPTTPGILIGPYAPATPSPPIIVTRNFAEAKDLLLQGLGEPVTPTDPEINRVA